VKRKLRIGITVFDCEYISPFFMLNKNEKPKTMTTDAKDFLRSLAAGASGHGMGGAASFLWQYR
jgi:hypothetical protein